jgi:hypothetical protein
VSKNCTRKFSPIGVAVTLLITSRLVLSALGGPPKSTLPPAEWGADKTTSAASAATAPPGQSQQLGAQQTYVGTNKCFICHRRQTDAWSETKHAHAFTDVPEKYRIDPTCLKCHLTAFGKEGGYASGTDKDLLMVGCESCHGPGAQHIDAAQRFVLANPGEEAKIENEMRSTIVKTPPDAVCASCHTVQAHQTHPPYDGALPSQVANTSAVVCDPAMSVVPRWTSTASTVHSATRYSIKTCGGCHYDQYKQWGAEKHAALAKMLPNKYSNDPSCQHCHPNASSVVSSPNASDESHKNWIGIACESCHGPALEHVLFNKQFISGPPLGPKLEQAARNAIRNGKPASTCAQCHIRSGHKEHVAYDRP